MAFKRTTRPWPHPSPACTQLSKDIAGYDGSPAAAKEILRGLAAARTMGIDLGPFEDALTERHRALDAA
jgi:hypothetical protein